MIVGIIRDIVEALPVNESPLIYPAFMHGERDIQNAIADEVESEVMVFLDEPITSNDIIKQGGYIEEQYPITMLFAKRSELDYTPEQHQELIIEMRYLSKRFLNRITSNQGIRSVSSVSRVDIKNIFDVNLTGVVLRITVVPFNSDSACP